MELSTYSSRFAGGRGKLSPPQGKGQRGRRTREHRPSLATTQEAEAEAKAARLKAKAKPVEDALEAARKKQADAQAEIALLQAKLTPAVQL